MSIKTSQNEEPNNLKSESNQNEQPESVTVAPETNASKIRKNLMLLILRQATDKEVQLSKELEVSVSKNLTQLLLQVNGVANLMVACDDLGGESFWANPAALSAIVQLLSRKPASVKSAGKYFAYILRHLLLLFKDKRWNKKVALLFSLLLDQLAKKAPQLVLVHVVDKITRPFELLLERGNLSADAEQQGLENAGGMWNKRLDDAVWTLARWLEPLPCTSGCQFPFCDRLLRLLPFWMHFLGQAHDLVKESSGGEEADNFLKDMAIVQDRLLRSFTDINEQAQYLVNQIFLYSDHPEVCSRHAYFELQQTKKKSLIMNSLVHPVEEEDDALNYSCVRVSVREEAFSLQDMIDFKFSALNNFLKNLPKEESGRLLFSILSAVFPRCKQSPMGAATVQDAMGVASTSSFRFVQVDKDFLPEKDEDVVFLPHYVLTRVVELLSEFDFTGLEDKLDENNLLSVVDVAEEITECYKNKMNLSDQKSSSSAPVLGDMLIQLEDNVEPALCGHCLIEISKALRRRDTKLFSQIEHFDKVYDKLLEKLQNEDTYIFLAAINALAELAYWKTTPFLGKLVDLFVDWRVNINECEENSDKAEKENVMRCKLGEALAKVCRQLGDFSPMYFDAISNSLLAMIERSIDDQTRASALSSLADLVLACRGRYFVKILQELMLCISQLLSSSSSSASSNLVRRAAIHLLRSMVVSATMSCDGSIFEIFASSITRVTHQLKRLWAEDRDDVVRLHSELALLEIQDAVKQFFHNPMEQLSERRKVL